MPFIDIHTHNEAREDGIVKIRNIFPGDGFAAHAGNNYYSVGLHPWHVKSDNDKKLSLVEKALLFDQVIAIGECGLDKLSDSDFEEQKRVFSCQVELSEKYKKPLIIHNVKAVDELLKVRNDKKALQPWIIHGFIGSEQLAAQLLEKGFLFSFGGILFQEKAKGIASFKSLPLEKVFFETDELDCSVADIYHIGAELMGMDIQLLKSKIEDNFNKIFRLG